MAVTLTVYCQYCKKVMKYLHIDYVINFHRKTTFEKDICDDCKRAKESK